MGTALTDAQVDAIARLAPRALFCQDPDTRGPGVGRARASRRCAQHNRGRTTRGVEFRIVRLPGGRGPGGRRPARRAPRRCARCSTTAVPIERFEVERALELADRRARRARRDAAPRPRGSIAPLPAERAARGARRSSSPSRLGLGENLVNEVLRAAAPRRRRAPRRRGAAGSRATTAPARRVAQAAAGTAARPRGRRAAPAPPPEPVDPHAALARREQSERAFLALCLALPDEGERRLAEVDVEDYFSAPATREAAAYLRGRLRTPAADLPPGDEALARLVAELVIRAGDARGDAGQARARGAAARPAPARAPHLRAPGSSGAHGRPARSPPSASGCSTRSATG